ncbi:hypothetical protein EJB05_00450, partial [Eragrostis curvula]
MESHQINYGGSQRVHRQHHGIIALPWCLQFLLLAAAQRRTKSTGSLTFFHGEAVEIVELEQETRPKRFSYDELADATDNFSDDMKLGEEGFGLVYRGFLDELNLSVAIKGVPKSSRQGWKEFMSEVKIISRLGHRNLVVLISFTMASATTSRSSMS